MKNVLVMFAGLAIAASTAFADTQVFQSIASDADAINREAAKISRELKSKRFDALAANSRIEQVGRMITTLRATVDGFDSNGAANLTGKQRDDWEKVKLKAQLLSVVYDNKQSAMADGLNNKNRQSVRAHAEGIALRAEMLKKTASQLGS